MNWEALGAVAELMGAIGVLITLVYLAQQIRHNSASVDSATEDGLASGFNDINVQVGSDPALTKIMITGLEEPEKLSEEENMQFTLLWRCYMNQYYRLYVLYDKGVFSKERWNEYAKEAAHATSLPGGKAWREANPGMPEFWEELEKHRGDDVLGFRVKASTNDA